MEKSKKRKDTGVKSWEFGVKSRDLSEKGRTKETRLDYKPVAIIY